MSNRGGLLALLRETALYGVASLAGTLATFVLAPVYLHVLDPAEYGTAALVTTVGTFLSMASILALDTAAHRMFWESSSDAHRHTVFGNWLRVSLAASTALSVLLAIAWLISAISGSRNEILDLSAIWGISLPFRIGQHVRVQWARVHRRPLSAAGWALALAFLTGLGGVLFVPVLGYGAFGVIASQTIAVVVVGGLALAAPVTRTLLRSHLDRPLLRRMFRFSLPLLPTGLASWFLAVGDRWILEIRYDSTAVGLYQAAFTVAGLLTLPLAAFNQAFPPWAFSIHTDSQAAAQLRRAFKLVLFAVSAGALIVSLGASTILRVVAQPEFADATSMVPYLAFSVVAQAIFAFTAIGCNIAERNGPVAIAVLLGGASIMPVVIITDQWLGADSVALSTLVSQVVTAAYVTWSAERLWRVGYGWGAPVFAAAACITSIWLVA